MPSKFFNPIINLIKVKLGLKPYLTHLMLWQEAVEERMAMCHLSTYEEYFNKLLISADEFQELTEKIVNQETWFFRDKIVFDTMLDWIKSAQFRFPHIKILSLACSTGEEPYSISMACFIAGLSRAAFSIDAYDISHNALVKAGMGIYSKNSFRGKDLNFRDQFFLKTNVGYIIKEEIKEQVHFYYGNILEDDPFLVSHSYQLIFCRNILIYFDKEAQKKVLNRIKNLLAPEGMLIVGSAEKQIALKEGFSLANSLLANALILKRKKDETFPSEKQAKILKQQPLSLNTHSSLPNVANLKEKKEASIQKAFKLADAGCFDESLKECLGFIEQYGGQPEVYFLLGLINQAKGDDEQAETFFLRTINLIPSHYEALLCLALLYERKGDFERANLFHQRAKRNIYTS